MVDASAEFFHLVRACIIDSALSTVASNEDDVGNPQECKKNKNQIWHWSAFRLRKEVCSLELGGQNSRELLLLTIGRQQRMISV